MRRIGCRFREHPHGYASRRARPPATSCRHKSPHSARLQWVGGFCVAWEGERRNVSGAAERRAQAAPLPEGTRRTHHSGKGGQPTREEAGRKGRSPAGDGDARNHARTCPLKRLSDKFSGRSDVAARCRQRTKCRAGDDGQRPTAHRRPAHCANGWDAGPKGARPGCRMVLRSERIGALPVALWDDKGCGKLRSAGSRAQPALYRTRSAAHVSLQSDNWPQPEREGKATGETPTLSALVISSRFMLRAGGRGQYYAVTLRMGYAPHGTRSVWEGKKRTTQRGRVLRGSWFLPVGGRFCNFDPRNT